jgi:hypothetical protein
VAHPPDLSGGALGKCGESAGHRRAADHGGHLPVQLVCAVGSNGREGHEEIRFNVQNGPGVVVAGLRPGSTRRGQVRLTVDAFSADDPFDPRHAEARSSIPIWVWVMSLFVVAWAVWYAARMWEVPPAFAHTPTYASTPQPAAGSK